MPVEYKALKLNCGYAPNGFACSHPHCLTCLRRVLNIKYCVW